MDTAVMMRVAVTATTNVDMGDLATSMKAEVVTTAIREGTEVKGTGGIMINGAMTAEVVIATLGVIINGTLIAEVKIATLGDPTGMMIVEDTVAHEVMLVAVGAMNLEAMDVEMTDNVTVLELADVVQDSLLARDMKTLEMLLRIPVYEMSGMV
ncbi:hypothetical protein PHMEG_0001518 [Phytophthora megakarya]|uniref:Uncharacterized protein n=1 Tax=Phytophthora megakarya TaxID=4795 RepID=A0A225X0C3_9STRA|nr:hypothetical protein PHMEG_0001518 [Phytophthora megakarya]